MDEPVLDNAQVDFLSRLKAALAVAEAFESGNTKNLAEEIPFVKKANPNRFHAIISTFPGNAKAENIELACYLVFLLTDLYPEEAFPQAERPLPEIPGSLIDEHYKNLVSLVEKNLGPKEAEEVKAARKAQRLLATRRAIAPFVIDKPYVGYAKLFEILYEVFAAKYSYNGPKIYLPLLRSSINDHFNIRPGCQFEYRGAKEQHYAVSYQGKMSKPMHDSCEDCCFSYNFSSHFPLYAVVVCDGVGSALHSSDGSYCAGQAVVSLLSSKLKEWHIERGLQSEKKAIERIKENALPYMQFQFGSDLYRYWQYFVEKTEAFHIDGEKATFADFATTLQFVFVTPAYVFTGKLGDGHFYVRKKDNVAGSQEIGIFSLNDGYSGVTQSSVFTLPHLYRNPGLLRVEVFPKSEVHDVLLHSDGLDGNIPSISKAYSLMNGLHEADFEAMKKRLDDLAMLSADVSLTLGGSGDDSSVAYLRMEGKR